MSYQSSEDPARLVALALVVLAGFYFDVSRRTRLTVFADGVIGVDHAFTLLGFDGIRKD